MNVFVLFMLHLLLSCEFKTKQTSQTLAHVIEIKLPPPPHKKKDNTCTMAMNRRSCTGLPEVLSFEIHV